MNKPKKTVWLFQVGEPLPTDPENRKMRTALLADVFHRRGYRVIWWASAFDHMSKKWLASEFEVIDYAPDYDIALLHGCGYQKNISLKRFYDHRLMAKQFVEKSGDFPQPDVVVASFPTYDLAEEAVAYARERNIPAIVDVRDMWPDIFLAHLPKFLRPMARLALSSEYGIVKRCLKKATALTSMMNEVLSWALDAAGRKRGEDTRVFYLGSAPSKDPEKVGPTNFDQYLPKLQGKFVVTFIGTFGHANSPMVLAEMARELQNEPIVFVIAGHGVLHPKISEAVAGLDNVIMPGWVNESEMSKILAHSSVGVVPATVATAAFPNKAFVYLSAGLPVISSCMGEFKTLLEETGAGFYYDFDKPEQLSALLKKLPTDPEQLVAARKNAKQLFEQQLSSDKIYSDYVDYVEEIVNHGNPSPS